MPEDETEEKKTGWALPLITAVLGFLGGNGALAIYFADRIWPENRPPTASIAIAPKEGVAPLQIAVNGAGSLDPDGDALTYKFSVGDEEIQPDDGTFEHVLREPGTFAIGLEVTDPDGLTANAGDTVTVAPRYDPVAFIEVSNRIDDLIDAKFYFRALDQANATRHTCAAPDSVCATVHAQAAEAQRFLRRFEEGRTSVEKARQLDPENPIYVISLAEFLLLLGEEDSAAQALGPMAQGPKKSMPGVFYFALATALQGDYGEASRKMNQVANEAGSYSTAARLVREMILSLEQGEAYQIRSEEISASVCGDPELLYIAFEQQTLIDAHLWSIQQLMLRLPEPRKELFKGSIEAAPCG